MDTNATRCQLKFWWNLRCELTPTWSFIQVCERLPLHIYKPRGGERSSHMTSMLDLEMVSRSDFTMEAAWCRIHVQRDRA